MSRNFEVLDSRETELGELMLRRRRLLSLNEEVFEVKLGEAFLMSSLFHEVEVALAKIALAEMGGDGWDVVVGGLGLGYTAVAALEHAQVRSLIVVEFLAPVIEWHQRGLVPLGPVLTRDRRCKFEHADFFGRAQSPAGFDAEQPGRLFDAVLLDIDHSPTNLLHHANATFYTADGLRSFARHFRSGGVFGLWSDDPPDESFMTALGAAFIDVRAHEVSFANPLLDTQSTSTVYVARKPASG
jgi:spermidine synthase